jgi:hypothetical protein
MTFSSIGRHRRGPGSAFVYPVAPMDSRRTEFGSCAVEYVDVLDLTDRLPALAVAPALLGAKIWLRSPPKMPA